MKQSGDLFKDILLLQRQRRNKIYEFLTSGQSFSQNPKLTSLEICKHALF